MARLPWADFAGDINGHAPFGAAIFAHPSNPQGAPEWMARHYGMLAAGWPGVKPRTLAPGESVTHRYRLWIHRGNPEAAEIQKAYDAYVAGS